MRTKYIYETIDQFFGLHNSSSLKKDRKAVFVDLINFIQKLKKHGVTYFPKFYQLLKEKAKLTHIEIKKLVYELSIIFSQIYLSMKTNKNMNYSDMNLIISNAVLDAPLDVGKFILKYLSNHKKTNNKLFVEKLDELIKSIDDQKNANLPAQLNVNQSENNQNTELTIEADQSYNNQNTELTIEADQSYNNQNNELTVEADQSENWQSFIFDSLPVIQWNNDNDNDNENDIYNPCMEFWESESKKL